MVSFDKSDPFNDESDDGGSISGSSGTGTFPFCFDDTVGHVEDSVGRVDNSIGRVSGVGSGVFDLTLIDSIGDVFLLVVFVTKGFEFKGGRLIEIFWHQKS